VTQSSDIYELASIAGSCIDAARESAGSVSQDLLWAIDRARARDPEQRPQSAAMFAQMLRTAGRLAVID
jgi:hypothetical protein